MLQDYRYHSSGLRDRVGATQTTRDRGVRTMTAEISVADNGEEIDPRRLRSRARLLDAATSLLATGGVEAVTIEAVTRASKVARATLYRHFSSSTQLLAATFDRLLPQVTPPTPDGSVRERLIELLSRQAALIQEAPIQLTTLGWLALGPTQPEHSATPADARHDHDVSSLRARVIEQYRQPFDQILDSPETRTELGEFEPTLALSQLVGPIVFARLTGLRSFQHADCVRLVDDFLAARGASSAQ